MPVNEGKNDAKSQQQKRCPVCQTENELSAAECTSCGYQFPRPGQPRFKACPACSALNVNSAVSCHSCGASFQVGFVLTLDEALRAGAIIRGIDIEEDEVQLGEEMAAPVRERILRSGDEQLVRIFRILPEESLRPPQRHLGAALADNFNINQFSFEATRGLGRRPSFTTRRPLATTQSFDQIRRVAAIKTDDDLNVIDTFDVRCRLLRGLFPLLRRCCHYRRPRRRTCLEIRVLP